MFLTEYDEEKTYAAQRREGITEGEHKNAVKNALTMLEDGLGIEKTSLYSGLPVEEVVALSKEIKAMPV